MAEPESSIRQAKNGDDEVEYFMRVDRQFAGQVNDIVKRLNLSHFTVVTDYKIP